MDDDKKSSRQKGPRKGGSKPAPRGDKPFRKGPRSEGKSFEKRDGARKPYTPRGDRPMAADGERPQFKRAYKPREAGEGTERGERPFRKGPRPEGKPFEKRDGARKPYT
ncbi:MAG: RNA pseudouridine synthase, partial [Mesorhizobium sp.]